MEWRDVRRRLCRRLTSPFFSRNARHSEQSEESHLKPVKVVYFSFLTLRYRHINNSILHIFKKKFVRHRRYWLRVLPFASPFGKTRPTDLLWTYGKAEAMIVFADVGHETVASRHKTPRRIAVITTAAHHTFRASSRPRRIILWRYRIISTTKPITTPFPNISAHIINSVCPKTFILLIYSCYQFFSMMNVDNFFWH